MADENTKHALATDAGAETPATTPKPRKVRGPGRKKVAVESVAAAAESTAAKSTPVKRGKQSRTMAETLSKALPPTSKTNKAKDDSKTTGRKVTGRSVQEKAPTASPAIAEMADLLQLEEENKGLRKALADKLRSENADLRKRLGQN